MDDADQPPIAKITIQTMTVFQGLRDVKRARPAVENIALLLSSYASKCRTQKGSETDDSCRGETASLRERSLRRRPGRFGTLHRRNLHVNDQSACTSADLARHLFL